MAVMKQVSLLIADEKQDVVMPLLCELLVVLISHDSAEMSRAIVLDLSEFDSSADALEPSE
eukprot:scaffold66118_cov115-Cyclotella_meneghiniana.AAC.2